MDYPQEKFEADIKAEYERLNATSEAVSETQVETNTEVEVTEQPTERQYTDLEVEQMAKGWDPNKEGGISAAEFKRVGEIIDAKRRASKEAQYKAKEVEELTKTVKQLVEHNKLMAKQAQEAAAKALALKKMEKIQEGDVNAVLAIEAEQKALEANHRVEEVAPPAPVESEAVSAFKEKYKDALQGTSPEDKRIQALVQGQVKYYMDNDPNIDESVAISEIESMLAATFPQRFESKTKPKVSKVGSSTTSKSTNVTNDLVANMSLDDKGLYHSIKAVDPSFTVEQFADMYLKKRK